MALDENALAALAAWVGCEKIGEDDKEAESHPAGEQVAGGEYEADPSSETITDGESLKEILAAWEEAGINPANLEKFFNEVAAVIDIPMGKLLPEADLVKDLGLDTFRYYTMVVLAENLFHERIPDRELLNIGTLKEFIRLFTA